MSSPDNLAIRVANLSKMYKLYHKPSDMFWELVRGKARFKEFWALQDVSFEVNRGQVVGIIGRNGAGKSTLLKILTGTLDKTLGEVVVNGRVSSILELGTGFSPEYTGRENVYLGGLMVGMTREEIQGKMDWIVDFSELESVIDQPFKTYSTGMQARLTFSTAVCIDPDILIIDEALSVGDVKFRRKCFGKIDEFRREDRTILLVSHDLNTVATFCDHAILLEGGRVVDQGEPQYITKVYYRMVFCEDDASLSDGGAAGDNGVYGRQTADIDDGAATTAVAVKFRAGERTQDIEAIRQAALQRLEISEPFEENNPNQMRMGNGRAEILDLGIWDEHGNRTTLLTPGSSYTFFVRALFREDVDGVVVGFLVRDVKGVDLYGVSTLTQKITVPEQQRGSVIEARLAVRMHLTNGSYFLTVALADPYAETNVQYDIRYDALQFDVGMKPDIFTTSMVDLNANLVVEKLM